jgi:hypothetical protein
MWLSFALVFLIGFAAHRASLCTVRAVMQWVEQRKAGLFISFFKASAWATLLTGIFVWAGLPIQGAPMLNISRAFSVAGGLLFGVGAAINGGCSLSTLQRLADGDLRFVVTLVFVVLGGLAVSGLQSMGVVPLPKVEPLLWPTVPGAIRNPFILVLSVWAVWQLAVLWRCRDPDQRLGQWLLAPRYRLTLAAMVLGGCSGLLFLLEGAWTYTNYLRELGSTWVAGAGAPGFHRAGLVLVLFLGMVTSAVQRRSFQWRGGPGIIGWRNALGGGLMGVAGAVIPGGNDTVLLVLVPNLAGQGLLSFLAMLVGIRVVVKVMKT